MTTHMRDEAAHSIVIPLTDHRLPEWMISWPVAPVSLRECVTKVKEDHLGTCVASFGVSLVTGSCC